jgi:hypothetical protein
MEWGRAARLSSAFRGGDATARRRSRKREGGTPRITGEESMMHPFVSGNSRKTIIRENGLSIESATYAIEICEPFNEYINVVRHH